MTDKFEAELEIDGVPDVLVEVEVDYDPGDKEEHPLVVVESVIVVESVKEDEIYLPKGLMVQCTPEMEDKIAQRYYEHLQARRIDRAELLIDDER